MPKLMEQIWSPDTCECVVRETWWRYFCTDCNYFNSNNTWCSYHNEYKPPSSNGVYQNCDNNTDEPERIHTLKSFDYKCSHHANLPDGGAYAQVKHDNFKKNDALDDLMVYLGSSDFNEFRDTYLDTSTYPQGFYYTGSGDMVVIHFVTKDLNQGQINSWQRRVDNRFGEGEIIIE